MEKVETNWEMSSFVDLAFVTETIQEKNEIQAKVVCFEESKFSIFLIFHINTFIVKPKVPVTRAIKVIVSVNDSSTTVSVLSIEKPRLIEAFRLTWPGVFIRDFHLWDIHSEASFFRKMFARVFSHMRFVPLPVLHYHVWY